MAKLLGPLIGAIIDRRDGDSGIKGAFVGGLVQSGLRAAGGLMATLAVGWAVKKTVDRFREKDEPAVAPARRKKATA